MTTSRPEDIRPTAWVTAWDRLEAAQKLKVEPGKGNRVLDEFPDLYWSLLDEAAIYAQLARAADSVGETAGSYVAERERLKAEEKKRIAEFNEKLEAAKAAQQKIDDEAAADAQRHPVRAAADRLRADLEARADRDFRATLGIPADDVEDQAKLRAPLGIPADDVDVAIIDEDQAAAPDPVAKAFEDVNAGLLADARNRMTADLFPAAPKIGPGMRVRVWWPARHAGRPGTVTGAAGGMLDVALDLRHLSDEPETLHNVPMGDVAVIPPADQYQPETYLPHPDARKAGQ